MRTRGAAVVLVLALAARAAVLFAFDGGPSRPFEGDEQGYAAVAGSLARGEGFSMTVAGFTPGGLEIKEPRFAFRAPLLPLVLAPVHFATGGHPAALRIACAILGALAAPLAFGVASRIAGPRAAWYAGLAVAFWPSHAWLSARVLSEPLDSVLLLAAADLLTRDRWIPGGATLGLAVLCRPGGLIAALCAIVQGALSEERGRRLKPFVLALLACAAVVTPWVVRNHQRFGRPLLVTSGGVTLFGGNCAAALQAEHPGKWVEPGPAWQWPSSKRDTREYLAPDLGMYGWNYRDEAASDRRFTEAAAEWVRENPLDAVRLAFWKVVRFLDPDTHSAKGDSRLKSILGWVSWGPTFLLVLLALWKGRKAKEPEWRLGLALLVGHLLAAVVAYGDARMRAPIEPALLALLAAPFLSDMVAKWTGRLEAVTVKK
jgi:4-amino-4-deoxy-L-arabinose transferase-like glycosyltransferase